jgi:hypothetical protein
VLAVVLLILALALVPPSARAQKVNGSIKSWQAPKTGSGTFFIDPITDQQTGSAEGDLVGNAANPTIYEAFNPGTKASLTDGTLFFRARLGADASPLGQFKGAFFAGIDANADGRLDLFLGVDNSGSTNAVGIWMPGTGQNVSPNTTTIVNPAAKTYTETATNYHFAAVSSVLQPGVTQFDINADGKTDQFLSFAVPFQDVVAQLSSSGIAGVNEDTKLRYVFATATQANSLNQDIGGVGKTFDPNATWASLGVFSQSAAVRSFALCEPSTLAMLLLALLGAAGRCCCATTVAGRIRARAGEQDTRVC